MRKTILQTLFLSGSILLLTACGGTNSAPSTNSATNTYTPENRLSAQSMDAVLWFNTSAEAQVLYLQTYELAKLKLRRNMERVDQNKPIAVVVDIDETVLDNSPYQLQLLSSRTTFSSETWSEWVNSSSAKALPGALDFAKFCEQMNVEVFYISNRSVSLFEGTLVNLKTEGFPYADEDHILLMESDLSDKSERRERVSADFQIALYLGDNLRDFREDFTERGGDFGKDKVNFLKKELEEYFVIFPNPMYGEWTKMFIREAPEDELQVKQDIVNRTIYE